MDETVERPQVVTITGPVSLSPRAARVDEIMREVGAQLGEEWLVARLSGSWVFQKRGCVGVVSRRSFIHALADSLGVTVNVKIASS